MAEYPPDVSPSLGLIAFYVVAALIALGIAFVVFAFYRSVTAGDSYRADDWRLTGIVGTVVCLLAIIITALAMYPYSYQYHSWRTKAGVVKEVDSRWMGSSAEKFVVTFENGESYGVEDTRASLIRPGDTVVLRCKRAWQFEGQDGWDCTFKDRIPGGAR